MFLRYRPDIDGLRAIAVLLVLVFHFDLFGIGHAGFIGVDIFFVISGYLIAGIIRGKLDQGSFRLKQFYIGRFRRLAPALFATQLLTLIVGLILLIPGELIGLARESLFAQIYGSNIYYWKTLSYFGVRSNSAFMLHSWSLAVEEQFYLFFPLLLVAVHRFARRWLPAVLIAVLLGSFTLNLVLTPRSPSTAFYLLPPRGWEFMTGALIGFVPAKLAKARPWAGFAGILLVAAALVFYGPQTSFPGWFALLPTLGAALLLFGGESGSGPITQLLSRPALVGIGRISYSLYLVHWPIRVFGELLAPNYGPFTRWTLFALSFALAYAIFRFVEQPVRHRRWWQDDRRTLIAYGASLALLLPVLGGLLLSHGLPQRFPAHIAAVAAANEDADPEEARWDWNASRPFAASLRPIGTPGQRPHWLIMGDSHAAALTRALSIWLASRGEAGVVVYRSACMPLLHNGVPGCRAFNEATHAYLKSQPALTDVMLLSIWRQAFADDFTDHDGRIVKGKAAEAAFETDMAETLNSLTSMGRRIHIWEPLPAAKRSVPGALARNMLFGWNTPLSVSQAEHRETFGFLKRVLGRHQALIYRRIDPADSLCASGQCTVMMNSLPLFHDNNHIAQASSPFFAKLIAKAEDH